MQSIVKNSISELAELCTTFGVKRMYVFGSAASGNFDVNSDIDFLISFMDTLFIKQYSDNYFELLRKLRHLFNREIDLVTERTLSNPYFIESVKETKQLIYEA